jgi:hypothetical protein
MKTLNAVLIATTLISTGATAALASSDDSAPRSNVSRFIATGDAVFAAQAGLDARKVAAQPKAVVDLTDPGFLTN